ncbi:MAG TPA: hypothetical protein VJH05_02620 [Candidatus Paceibacterota bacterium]
MKTAVTILAVFLVIGFLIAVGTVVFGFGSFSKSLPKGEGGIYEFNDGNFKQLSGSVGLRARDFLFSKINENVIYVGTAGDGIWVSKDNGDTFKKAQDKVFADRVDVYDIEEDLSGNLYSSVYNYKDDRGALIFSSYPPENSSEIYFSSISRFGVFGASLDGGAVSIVSSDGGFYRSVNNGKSWELRSRRGEGLLKMESFAGNKYVLNSENKIIATSDAGKTWKDVSPKIGIGKTGVQKFHLDKRTGSMIALSDKILFSQNGGASWRELNLLVSPGELPVISVSISPANSNTIYAASENILYVSADGGNSWSVFEIPTSRKVASLFVDSKMPNSLFIGTE